MAEFIEILSPKALADLKTANDEVIKLVSGIDKAGKAMKNIKTPSGSDSAVKALNDKLIRQEKLYTDLQIKLQRYAQQQAQTQIKNNQLEQSTIRLNKAKEQSIKQLERENVKLQQANSLYNQTQQKVNELTKVYNDLAIKKELGQKFTAKELMQLNKLTVEINTYQTALKKVDADIQKNGRNVGNYASHWNGLGNAFNQLSREMPAFANSAQTGFMALSNNLPILFDEITKIKNANKELIAQGQPVKSVFSQIAGAIFSVGTVLSVGVTLLTLYGAQIWDSISGSKEKKKALEAEKKAIEAKVEAERQQNETIGQSIAQEQNRARVLFEIAKNEEVSATKRKEALDELRQRYGKYLKDLSDQQILAGETAKAEEELNRALVGRGYALATQNLLEQNLTKQMEAQVEYEKATRKAIKGVVDQTNAQTGAIKNSDKYMQAIRNNAKVNNEAGKVLEAKLKPLKAEEDALLSLFRTNAKYLDSVDETVDKKKKEKKAVEEATQAQTNSKEAFEKNIRALEEQLATIDRFNPAYDTMNGLLEFQKYLYDQLFGSIKKVDEAQNELIGVEGLTAWIDKVGAVMKGWLALQKATDDYIKMISGDAFNQAFDNIGFSSAKMFFDMDENGMSTYDKLMLGADTLGEKIAITFKAVGDVAKDVFRQIEQAQNRRFENQINNLNQEYEISKKLAGDNADAQAEIDRQYEAKLREIRIREFKAKKRLAIVEANINIAQGIIASLAKGGTAGIVMAGIIGALGIVQLATIQNQEMPEYWTGTENAKEGFAKTQERGREFIFDKSGKLKSTGSDKGTQITKMDAGDKVWNADKTRKAIDAMMFNDQLNSILTSNGISSPIVNNRLNDERIVDALNSVEFAVKNIPVGGTELRNGEMVNYIQKANTRTILTNNRRTFTPRKV